MNDKTMQLEYYYNTITFITASVHHKCFSSSLQAKENLKRL